VKNKMISWFLRGRGIYNQRWKYDSKNQSKLLAKISLTDISTTKISVNSLCMMTPHLHRRRLITFSIIIVLTATNYKT
jgi:hypothetical protein